MALFDINIWLQLLLFPLITLGVWTLLFNSKNSVFTKIVVEGGYLLFVLPLIILTFLSIPALFVFFWARSANIGTQMTYAFIIMLVGITIIVEYFYIKKAVNEIERREQMSIWKYIRRMFSKEHREEVAKQKVQTKEEATDYFDEITEMNRKKRELDREEKEKLRRALLGEVETSESQSSEN